MFFPRGIALLGGISRGGSFGRLMFHSQLHCGYAGRIYPMCSKGREIAGVRILRNLGEAEGPVALVSQSGGAATGATRIPRPGAATWKGSWKGFLKFNG